MPENRDNNPFWIQSDIAQPALTIISGSIRIIVMSSLHRCISHNWELSIFSKNHETSFISSYMKLNTQKNILFKILLLYSIGDFKLIFSFWNIS